jgi:hypothetical protein
MLVLYLCRQLSAQAVARQLLVAVAFIHELGVVHTDL